MTKRACPLDHSDPDVIPKPLCAFCNPQSSREDWLATVRKTEMAEAKKSQALQMTEALAELNRLRSLRGIDPVKHWRLSYEALLEAIEESKKKIAENLQVSSGKATEAARKKSEEVRARKEAAPKNLAKAAKAAAKAKAKEEKAAAKAAGKKPATAPASKAPAAPPPAPAKPGTAAAFNQQLKNREGTNQAKLAAFLFDNLGKKVTNDKLAVAVYGKEAKAKGSAIGNVINGFIGKVKTVKGYKVEKTDDDVTLKKG